MELHTYEGARAFCAALFGFSGNRLVNPALSSSPSPPVGATRLARAHCGGRCGARLLRGRCHGHEHSVPSCSDLRIFVFAFESGAVSQQLLEGTSTLHLEAGLVFDLSRAHFPILAVVNGVLQAGRDISRAASAYSSARSRRAGARWILSFGNVWLNDLFLALLLLVIIRGCNPHLSAHREPGTQYFNRLACRGEAHLRRRWRR